MLDLPGSDPAPPTKSDKVAVWILSLFAGALLLLGFLEDYRPTMWSVPVFLLSWPILLVIHEFGHALTAKALGWRCERVCIGAGKLRATKLILGMPVEFRSIPLSGYASIRPADLISPRLKNCLIYAAGPGVELLAVAILWIIFGPALLKPATTLGPLLIAQAFSMAAMIGAVINLIPFTVQTEKGASWNDGLGMIMSWKIPIEYFAEAIDQESRNSHSPKS